MCCSTLLELLIFKSNKSAHLTPTVHMTETDLNLSSYIHSLLEYNQKCQCHKTSFLANQKKVHAVFTAAFSEPLTHYKANADFTLEGRSGLADISGWPTQQASLTKHGRLHDYSGHQQKYQSTSNNCDTFVQQWNKRQQRLSTNSMW